MSARPPTASRFRRRLRRAALWLGLAAAFLPTFFPSLHAGHGFPVVPPPSVAAAGGLSHQSAHSHHAHPAQHVSLTGKRDGGHGAPAAPDHRPTNDMCPICRTLQQIGTAVVPEIATVVEHDMAGGESAAPPVVQVSSASPYDPAQPRGPPVGI